MQPRSSRSVPNRRSTNTFGQDSFVTPTIDSRERRSLSDGGTLLADVSGLTFRALTGELGRRENFTDAFSADDFRIQFSFKYNFSVSVSGQRRACILCLSAAQARGDQGIDAAKRNHDRHD
jgi:hypothetical protein